MPVFWPRLWVKNRIIRQEVLECLVESLSPPSVISVHWKRKEKSLEAIFEIFWGIHTYMWEFASYTHLSWCSLSSLSSPLPLIIFTLCSFCTCAAPLLSPPLLPTFPLLHLSPHLYLPLSPLPTPLTPLYPSLPILPSFASSLSVAFSFSDWLLKTGKLASCEVLIPTNRVSEVKTSQPNIRY